MPSFKFDLRLSLSDKLTEILLSDAGRRDYLKHWGSVISFTDGVVKFQEHGGKTHTITADTIRAGVVRVLRGRRHSSLRGQILRMIQDDDEILIDDHMLDVVVQVGLFGRIIHG